MICVIWIEASGFVLFCFYQYKGFNNVYPAYLLDCSVNPTRSSMWMRFVGGKVEQMIVNTDGHWRMDFKTGKKIGYSVLQQWIARSMEVKSYMGQWKFWPHRSTQYNIYYWGHIMLKHFLLFIWNSNVIAYPVFLFSKSGNPTQASPFLLPKSSSCLKGLKLFIPLGFLFLLVMPDRGRAVSFSI